MCNTKVWWYIGVEITKFEISCHHTSCKFWIGPFHQQPHLVLKFIFLFYHQYVQYILSLGLWSWIKGKGNKSLKEKNPEWILLSNPQLWHFGMLWYQLYLGLHNVNMKKTHDIHKKLWNFSVVVCCLERFCTSNKTKFLCLFATPSLLQSIQC